MESAAFIFLSRWLFLYESLLNLPLPSSKRTFSQPFQKKCICELMWISTITIFIWVSYEKPSSSLNCVMQYCWWSCRGNLKLIILGSERVNRTESNITPPNEPCSFLSHTPACRVTPERSLCVPGSSDWVFIWNFSKGTVPRSSKGAADCRKVRLLHSNGPRPISSAPKLILQFMKKREATKMYTTKAIMRSLRTTLVLRTTIIANRSFVQVARLLASLFVQTGNGGCDLSRFSVAVLYIHIYILSVLLMCHGAFPMDVGCHVGSAQ